MFGICFKILQKKEKDRDKERGGGGKMTGE